MLAEIYIEVLIREKAALLALDAKEVIAGFREPLQLRHEKTQILVF